MRDGSQESAEIADVQAAAHLLRDRGLRSEEALEPLEVRGPTDCGAGAIGARGLARSHIGLGWG